MERSGTYTSKIIYMVNYFIIRPINECIKSEWDTCWLGGINSRQTNELIHPLRPPFCSMWCSSCCEPLIGSFPTSRSPWSWRSRGSAIWPSRPWLRTRRCCLPTVVEGPLPPPRRSPLAQVSVFSLQFCNGSQRSRLWIGYSGVNTWNWMRTKANSTLICEVEKKTGLYMNI